jgi:hypothetical protein
MHAFYAKFVSIMSGDRKINWCNSTQLCLFYLRLIGRCDVGAGPVPEPVRGLRGGGGGYRISSIIVAISNVGWCFRILARGG